MRTLVHFALLLSIGCGSDRLPAVPDAGGDSAADTTASIDAGTRVTEPALPRTDSCPPNWEPMNGACVPALVDEASCPEGLVPIPGQAECTRAGGACPVGRFPEGVEGSTLYVDGAADVMGDGSEAAPFRTIERATRVATAGTTIAVAKGIYDETVAVPSDVILRGACAAETRIVTSSLLNEAGAIIVSGRGVEIRSLGIGGTRPGIAVAATGSARVIDVVIDQATLGGILVEGGELVAERLVVRSTIAMQPSGPFGMGIFAREGSMVDVSESFFTDNAFAGILAWGAEVSLRDVAVVNTRQQPTTDEPSGAGVLAVEGATVTIERGYFDRNGTATLVAFDPGTSLTATDVVVADTQTAQPSGNFGRGLYVGFGGEAAVERGYFLRNGTEAVVALRESRVTLTDTTIAETLGREGDGYFAYGINVETGSEATLARVRVRDNGGRAVFVRDPGSALSFSDLTITGTRGTGGPVGAEGTALHAQQGANLQGERLRVERAVGAAVIAADSDTTITLSDVSILDTLERACSPGCGELAMGDALVSALDAHIDLTRFEIGRSVRVGINVLDGTVALHEGVVFDNPIGANVLETEFETAELSDRVEYINNGRNLATQGLRVPSISVP